MNLLMVTKNQSMHNQNAAWCASNVNRTRNSPSDVTPLSGCITVYAHRSHDRDNATFRFFLSNWK